MKTELEEAAAAFVEAPKKLRAAIVTAGQAGETSVKIAETIGFVYSPDYVARIIRDAIGPRRPGRKPRTAPADS